MQSTFGLIVNLTQFIGMSAQQNVDWPAELDPFFELFSFTNLNMCVTLSAPMHRRRLLTARSVLVAPPPPVSW